MATTPWDTSLQPAPATAPTPPARRTQPTQRSRSANAPSASRRATNAPTTIRRESPIPPTAPPQQRRNAPGPNSTTRRPASPFDAPEPMATLAETLGRLAQPIPSAHVKAKEVDTKRGGSYKADYVHHATIRDLLDHRAPGWEWSIRLHDAAGLLYVIGTLTIHGTDGSISRDGIGNADDDLDSWGDPSSNAEAMAMRRAAMAIGLGRELWRKA